MLRSQSDLPRYTYESISSRLDRLRNIGNGYHPPKKASLNTHLIWRGSSSLRSSLKVQNNGMLIKDIFGGSKGNPGKDTKQIRQRKPISRRKTMKYESKNEKNMFTIKQCSEQLDQSFLPRNSKSISLRSHKSQQNKKRTKSHDKDIFYAEDFIPHSRRASRQKDRTLAGHIYNIQQRGKQF